MANNLPTDKKVLAISLLAEGASIRSIERITGVHRDTIMRLGVRVGEACDKLQYDRLQNLNCRHIQVDEIWGFIGKKRSKLREFESFRGFGDCWTYIALDTDTKLIPCYRVGLRSLQNTKAFIGDLSSRLANRIQLSSDALGSYVQSIERHFGSEVDYGQIVKTYSVTNLGKSGLPAAVRYSPAEVVRTEKLVIIGDPDPDSICTSHVEKQNHTLRMHCRRLTRLTNAFSKKYENFCAAVSLNFAYYNFCKRHIAVNTTPAQAAGVESNQWTVAELLERCGE